MDKGKKTRNGRRYPERSVESAVQTGLVYGALPILEILRSGKRKIDRIILAEGATGRTVREIQDYARESGVRIDRGSKREFQKYVEPTVNHQGVIALCSAAEYYDADRLISEIALKEDSFCLILDGIEDPRNLGAILRTVECGGVDGVFIPERRASGLTDTVLKASAGAVEYVKVAKVHNVNRLIDELKESGVWVVGADGEAEIGYDKWDWRQRSALVLGNEGKGIHRLTAEKCDILVKIPIMGEIDSLNVSVAAGVIIYEAVRQRGETDG